MGWGKLSTRGWWYKQKTLCGGDGMDIFWNQKILVYNNYLLDQFPAASSGLICHLQNALAHSLSLFCNFILNSG